MYWSWSMSCISRSDAFIFTVCLCSWCFYIHCLLVFMMLLYSLSACVHVLESILWKVYSRLFSDDQCRLKDLNCMKTYGWLFFWNRLQGIFCRQTCFVVLCILSRLQGPIGSIWHWSWLNMVQRNPFLLWSAYSLGERRSNLVQLWKLMRILNGKVQKNVVLREGVWSWLRSVNSTMGSIEVRFQFKEARFGGEKVPIWDHPIMFRFLFSVSELLWCTAVKHQATATTVMYGWSIEQSFSKSWFVYVRLYLYLLIYLSRFVYACLYL